VLKIILRLFYPLGVSSVLNIYMNTIQNKKELVGCYKTSCEYSVKVGEDGTNQQIHIEEYEDSLDIVIHKYDW